MYSLGLVAIVSVLLAYSLAPFLRSWFIGRGWVDKPDGERKVQVRPIPRAGGAVIAISYLASYAILAALHLRGWTSFHLDLGLVLTVLPGGALVFIIGLLDDTKGLPPLMKLSAQIVACLVAFIGGVHVSVPHWFVGGTWWFSLPLTLFWLLLCTNAFNLIDGLDGLSGGLACLIHES